MKVLAIYNFLCVYWSWNKRLYKLQIASVIISAFMINILGGVIYTYGNIQPYIVSFIRQRSHPPTLRFTQSVYMYSCQIALFTIGVITGSFIENWIGPRMSVLISGIGAGLGLILSIVSIKVSFGLLILTFGVMYGFSLGVLYVVSVVFIMKWVPKHAGIASGFTTGAIGIGTMFFNAFQTNFINPSNEYPNEAPYPDKPDETYFTQEDLLDRLLYMFLIEGLIYITATLIVSVFMVYPSPETNSDTDIVTLKNKTGLRPCQAMTKINFPLLWFIYTIDIIVSGVVFPLYKTYGLEVVRSSDHFLSVTGIVAGVASLAGRFLFGLLADKIDHKIAFVVNSSLMAVILLTMYTTSLQWSAMYLVWVSIVNLCHGGFTVLLAVAVLRDFGEKHLNANFAIIFTSSIAGSIVASIISEFCVDSLEWYGTFLLLGGLNCIQVIASLLLVNNKMALNKIYTVNLMHAAIFNLEF